MKSQALHELISKIFTDEKIKKQFESDPDSVLAQFSLSEQEKTAILNVHSRLGLVNSNSQQLEAAIEAEYTWFSVP